MLGISDNKTFSRAPKSQEIDLCQILEREFIVKRKRNKSKVQGFFRHSMDYLMNKIQRKHSSSRKNSQRFLNRGNHAQRYKCRQSIPKFGTQTKQLSQQCLSHQCKYNQYLNQCIHNSQQEQDINKVIKPSQDLYLSILALLCIVSGSDKAFPSDFIFRKTHDWIEIQGFFCQNFDIIQKLLNTYQYLVNKANIKNNNIQQARKYLNSVELYRLIPDYDLDRDALVQDPLEKRLYNLVWYLIEFFDNYRELEQYQIKIVKTSKIGQKSKTTQNKVISDIPSKQVYLEPKQISKFHQEPQQISKIKEQIREMHNNIMVVSRSNSPLINFQENLKKNEQNQSDIKNPNELYQNGNYLKNKIETQKDKKCIQKHQNSDLQSNTTPKQNFSLRSSSPNKDNLNQRDYHNLLTPVIVKKRNQKNSKIIDQKKKNIKEKSKEQINDMSTLSKDKQDTREESINEKEKQFKQNKTQDNDLCNNLVERVDDYYSEIIKNFGNIFNEESQFQSNNEQLNLGHKINPVKQSTIRNNFNQSCCSDGEDKNQTSKAQMIDPSFQIRTPEQIKKAEKQISQKNNQIKSFDQNITPQKHENLSKRQPKQFYNKNSKSEILSTQINISRRLSKVDQFKLKETSDGRKMILEQQRESEAQLVSKTKNSIKSSCSTQNVTNKKTQKITSLLQEKLVNLSQELSEDLYVQQHKKLQKQQRKTAKDKQRQVDRTKKLEELKDQNIIQIQDELQKNQQTQLQNKKTYSKLFQQQETFQKDFVQELKKQFQPETKRQGNLLEVIANSRTRQEGNNTFKDSQEENMNVPTSTMSKQSKSLQQSIDLKPNRYQSQMDPIEEQNKSSFLEISTIQDQSKSKKQCSLVLDAQKNEINLDDLEKLINQDIKNTDLKVKKLELKEHTLIWQETKAIKSLKLQEAKTLVDKQIKWNERQSQEEYKIKKNKEILEKIIKLDNNEFKKELQSPRLEHNNQRFEEFFDQQKRDKSDASIKKLSRIYNLQRELKQKIQHMKLLKGGIKVARNLLSLEDFDDSQVQDNFISNQI